MGCQSVRPAALIFLPKCGHNDAIALEALSSNAPPNNHEPALLAIFLSKVTFIRVPDQLDADSLCSRMYGTVNFTNTGTEYC